MTEGLFQKVHDSTSGSCIHIGGVTADEHESFVNSIFEEVLMEVGGDGLSVFRFRGQMADVSAAGLGGHRHVLFALCRRIFLAVFVLEQHFGAVIPTIKKNAGDRAVFLFVTVATCF